jgi:hypothetical protein
MRIEDKNPADLIRTEALRPIREISGSDTGRGGAQGAGSPPRADRVEISEAGRAMAAQGALSPERVADVRQKVAAGAYNTMEVAAEVARRMIARGDL